MHTVARFIDLREKVRKELRTSDFPPVYSLFIVPTPTMAIIVRTERVSEHVTRSTVDPPRRLRYAHVLYTFARAKLGAFKDPQYLSVSTCNQFV